MFDIFYNKNKNNLLFNALEKESNGDFECLQNYIPIYSKFFNINNTNWNNINLNHTYQIHTINKFLKTNNYIIKTTNNVNLHSFFKVVPLIDPIKYMTGKYKDISENKLFILPSLSNNSLSKINKSNNTAYIDGFFSFLLSKLLYTHTFIHGTDFYGSFLGLKNNLQINVADDMEYLQESEYFLKNNNTVFTMDNDFHIELMNYDSRKYKKKLQFSSNNTSLTIEDINNGLYADMFNTQKITTNMVDISNALIFDNFIKKNTSNKHITTDSSSCSSRSSITSCSSTKTDEESCNNNESTDTDDDTTENTSSSISMCSSLSEIVNVSIKKFPVNIICLEYLDATLDSYINEKDIPLTEWKSIFIQIIMMLSTYQKMFDFTHNDLHTNNIMYKNTDKKFLLYHINNTYYKVPTFGKIYKIIDFGRAIYKYRGEVMCSDSYSNTGDASTQYNCEPYFNPNKPRIDPNKAFDICRLGCSLFDYFIDDISEINTTKNPIAKKIIEWCTDNKGRNILYKKNGKERYPGFKLYKMIARTVHTHTPENQLNSTFFDCFKTTKRKINNKNKIIHIDKMPCYIFPIENKTDLKVSLHT